MTDGLDSGVGAVLQQHIDGDWRPIAYFSKNLKPAERRYSTFDRELLAIYLAIKHFHALLEGQQFHVLTDHKPVTHFLSANLDHHTLGIFITSVTFHNSLQTYIMLRVGTTRQQMHSHTEAVSQPHSPVGISFDDMAAAQKTDSEIITLQKSTSLTLEEVPLPGSSTTRICDMSTGHPRPVVPAQFHRTVLDTLHSLSHSSI